MAEPASRDRPLTATGGLERAPGGTVFLDEVAELPTGTDVALLLFPQEQ